MSTTSSSSSAHSFSIRQPADDPERAAALAELVAVTFDGMVLAWLADPDGANPERVFALLAELLAAPHRTAPRTPG